MISRTSSFFAPDSSHSSWIKESKAGPKDAEPRRGKPPTWYKEHDIPQFERMIANPDGAIIREKESEYQKNLDNMTSEIPVINIKLPTDN